MTSLREIAVGSTAEVELITGSDPTSERLLEMGITPGVHVRVVGVAPLGFLAIGWLAVHLGAPMAALTCAVSGLVVMALTWPLCRACFKHPGTGES